MTYDAAKAVLQAAGVRPHPSTVRVLRCLQDRGPRDAYGVAAYYGVDYRSTLNILHRLENAGLAVSYFEDMDVCERANATKPRLIFRVR